MSVHDDLGTRMKTFYEAVPKTKLIRRMPVAIRLDGKAFHTFTRGFQKPFDEVLGNTMVRTMEYLAKNIQGCVFAYQQSDEITLLLIDYQTFDTCAWLEYKVQKMCSISASMATMAFNKYFYEEVEAWKEENFPTNYLGHVTGTISMADIELMETYEKALNRGAMFDARCFNISKEEACNLIYWRQLDATRNSIQMVGQANFSYSELEDKSCNMIQDMLREQRGINWNDYPTRWKRGVACYREVESFVEIETSEGWAPDKEIPKKRAYWKIDYEMPILKGEDREYVDRHIFVGE